MSALTELADATRTVTARTAPSVVRIGRHGGRGCGVVVGDDRVLTNAHNLRGHQVTVTFADGHRETGTVQATDIDGDLAVVAVPTGDAPEVTWATQTPADGDLVFAVARGSSGASRTTFGSVSGSARAFRGPRGRRITGSVEHTAPLSRGSSGSPIVDADGAVVGLNTNRLGEGFYLALPADDDLRRRVDALATGASPVRRRLGVGLAPADVANKLRQSVGLPERDGLLIRLVEDDGPADSAGLRQGDLIVSVDGQAVAVPDDLYDALDRVADEGPLLIGIVRGAEELDVPVAFPS